MQRNAPLLVDIGQGLSLMIGLPVITTWDTKGRPKSPRRGTFGFNSETKALEYWDGIQWFGVLMETT